MCTKPLIVVKMLRIFEQLHAKTINLLKIITILNPFSGNFVSFVSPLGTASESVDATAGVPLLAVELF